MVFSQIDVAYYIVIRHGVFAWSEIPRFFFWVIGSILKTHHLILEVYDVVCLLVSQCSVLSVKFQKNYVTYFVLCEYFDHILFLNLLYLVLFLIVCIGLCDWIVKDFLALDECIRDLFIYRSFALEISLFKQVVVHFILPLTITIS